ncbi:hypothetical protein ACFSL6_00065 [Paenibacillus thailandensis]|uniref:hypothetical protein n=1 Tax=Paenibacillus thailandensis TaxID=393250 RepID=UPI0036399A61
MCRSKRTFQTEYALLQQGGLAGLGKGAGAQLSQARFRVMQETGGTSLIPISDNGKQMLLFKIVHAWKESFGCLAAGRSSPALSNGCPSC